MIHFLGCLSLLCYLALTHLGADGSPERIAWGLLVWLLVFLPYGWLAAKVWRLRGRESTTPSMEPKEGHQSQRASLFRATVFWALLFRIALLPAGLPSESPLEHLKLDLGEAEAGYQTFLLWDNDVWRYLWEGHLVTDGISPYRYSPAEILALADQGQPWAEQMVEEGPWLDVLDRISYGEHRSVYPPLALTLFRISHGLVPGSVLTWKVLLTALEFVGCLLFAALLARTGQRTDLTLLLAWNPLLIKEVAGSGHLDGVLILFLVAALLLHTLGQKTLAIGALTAAILVKLWPILFAPSLLLRSRWKAWWPLPLGLAIGYWPFRHDLQELLQAFRAFSAEWVFNPGPWLLFEQLSQALGGTGRAIPDALHLAITLGAVGITSWFILRKKSPTENAATIFNPQSEPRLQDDAQPLTGNARLASSVTRIRVRAIAKDWFLIGSVFLLFSATVMPWYLIALLPFAILVGAWPWLVATAAMLLSYGIYLDGKEHGWVLALEFGIVATAFLWVRARGHFSGTTNNPQQAAGR